MGYMMYMEFDLHIAAIKVDEAERVFRKALNDNGCSGRGDAEKYPLAWLITEWLGEDDSIATEEKPNPLVALASLQTRGDINVDGGSHRKWRNQEELLQALAPYVTAGGTVRCDGEDDYRGGYSFDGKGIEEWTEEYVTDSQLKTFDDNAKRLTEAEELLTELRVFLDEDYLTKKIDEFLNQSTSAELVSKET